MKLYATVKSDRATKGQGGEYIEIEVLNENREKIFSASINSSEIYATTYGEDAQCIEDSRRDTQKKYLCIGCGKNKVDKYASNCSSCEKEIETEETK